MLFGCSLDALWTPMTKDCARQPLEECEQSTKDLSPCCSSSSASTLSSLVVTSSRRPHVWLLMSRHQLASLPRLRLVWRLRRLNARRLNAPAPAAKNQNRSSTSTKKNKDHGGKGGKSKGGNCGDKSGSHLVDLAAAAVLAFKVSPSVSQATQSSRK